jgi:hypothetical protein
MERFRDGIVAAFRNKELSAADEGANFNRLAGHFGFFLGESYSYANIFRHVFDREFRSDFDQGLGATFCSSLVRRFLKEAGLDHGLGADLHLSPSRLNKELMLSGRHPSGWMRVDKADLFGFICVPEDERPEYVSLREKQRSQRVTVFSSVARVIKGHIESLSNGSLGSGDVDTVLDFVAGLSKTAQFPFDGLHVAGMISSHLRKVRRHSPDVNWRNRKEREVHQRNLSLFAGEVQETLDRLDNDARAISGRFKGLLSQVHRHPRLAEHIAGIDKDALQHSIENLRSTLDTEVAKVNLHDPDRVRTFLESRIVALECLYRVRMDFEDGGMP